jgi:tetratricopeptide (TPR) repeat protein
MKSNSSHFGVVLAIVLFAICSGTMTAQTGGKGGGGIKPSSPGAITPSNLPSTSTRSLLFISGRVLLDSGMAPPEPVVIERVCNGKVHREGYTDGHGAYQFQVDQDPGFQDASETTNTDPTDDPKLNAKLDVLKVKYQGCEFRAVLSGFVSSGSTLHLQGNGWQYELAPIILSHTDHAPGTTVSITSLNAPDDAKRAFTKGQKEYDQNKLPEAEKELEKAVRIYPGFAAAWSLLGDIHMQQKQPDDAIREYTQAMSADPQFLNPVFGMGLIAVQQKRWQDAVKYTDQVLKMNAAAYPSVYFYNAVANYNLSRLEPAEASARKFSALDTAHKHPDVHLLLSQIFIHQHAYADAAQELRQYLAVAPNAPNAGEVREQLSRLEQASVAKQ